MTRNEIKEHIIELEKDALTKWFNGDVSGYRNLWSDQEFSYFDGVVSERIDNYQDISMFLNEVEKMKLHADSFEFKNPRVQLSDSEDFAVLTYQLFADTNLIDMKYNCVEVFKKQNNGWKVIHSTWSFIRPMDMEWNKSKEIV